MPKAFKKSGVEALTHGPADNLAAVEIQDGRQIKPAFLGFNVGEVGHPELVGHRGLGNLGQSIGAMGSSWLLSVVGTR